METNLNILKQTVTRFHRAPETAINGELANTPYRARIAITDYGRTIANHFTDLLPRGLSDVCRRTSIPFAFSSFGLICEFERPLELNLYDDDMVLDENLKEIIGQFGPLILRNVYMSSKCRTEVHRNIFPDLNFHIDRGADQENQYSLFCRDPFDPVQKAERTSSTLVIANIVGYLQSLKEGGTPADGPQALLSIFKDQNLSPLIGKILLEQPWTAPEGTGEICIFDNRTVLHASYYKPSRGYPIGVRYLI